MAIRCPYCSREYDATLFEFNRQIRCVCGKRIALRHEEIFNRYPTHLLNEEKRLSEIKIMADRISFLIVSTDYPDIDIMIEKQKLRERISILFPDKLHLYDLIYEARFNRLSEQFRNNNI